MFCKNFNYIILISNLVFLQSLYAASNCAPSSISDNEQYRQFCLEMATDSALFTQFRNLPMCQRIVEAVNFDQGQEYLKIIKEQSPEILHFANSFKKSDLVGNPITYDYPSVGHFSPTTLRYIKVASDLKKLFGSLDNYTIVEIGGGYGGQCKIIADLFKFKKYIIIDLAEPIALTKKFLSEQGVENVEFLTPSDSITQNSFDLVISNYAYSELTAPSRKQYIEHIFAFAKKGYLTCNDAPHFSVAGSLFANKWKLLRELSEYQIPWKTCIEQPLTDSKNYMAIWNRS